MGPEFLGDFFREAIFLIVMIVAAIIGPSLMVGLVVATFQAATQINEQTLSFLPRLLVTLGCIVFFGPWIINLIIEYATRLYMNIPFLVS